MLCVVQSPKKKIMNATAQQRHFQDMYCVHYRPSAVCMRLAVCLQKLAVCVFVCVRVCLCVYVFVCVCVERERERDRDLGG